MLFCTTVHKITKHRRQNGVIGFRSAKFRKITFNLIKATQNHIKAIYG